MTVALTDFSSVDPWRADRAPATIRPRVAAALRRWLMAVITLPDRGHAATAQEIPPEYYRFPCF